MRECPALRIDLRGTALIEASAGTGKTHTIANLFLRLVLERALPVDEILVVTFTHAATAELRDRIRSRLRAALQALEGVDTDDADLLAIIAASTGHTHGTARLAQALRDFDKAAIFTIHGFCQRVLQHYAFESGMALDTQLLADPSALFEEVVHDFWHARMDEAHPLWLRYVSEVSVNPQRLAQLAHCGVAQPDTTILPPHANAQMDRALESFAATAVPTAMLWRSRGSVVAELLQSAGLKKNIYSPTAVRRWMQAMDEWASTAEPNNQPLPGEFSRFTNDALAGATRKGRQSPCHPIFDACARTWSAWVQARLALAQATMNLQLDQMRFARRTGSFAQASAQLDIIRRPAESPRCVARGAAGRPPCRTLETEIPCSAGG